jgi:hypothetical protein
LGVLFDFDFLAVTNLGLQRLSENALGREAPAQLKASLRHIAPALIANNRRHYVSIATADHTAGVDPLKQQRAVADARPAMTLLFSERPIGLECALSDRFSHPGGFSHQRTFDSTSRRNSVKPISRVEGNVFYVQRC